MTQKKSEKESLKESKRNRKMPKKRKTNRKPSKQKLEKRERNKKDKDWRKAIVKRYEGRCIICGDTKMPNAHHIIPRTFKETRWDERNGILLCPKHHKFGKFSAHKNPLWFITLFQDCDPFGHKYLINKLELEDGINN